MCLFSSYAQTQSPRTQKGAADSEGSLPTWWPCPGSQSLSQNQTSFSPGAPSGRGSVLRNAMELHESALRGEQGEAAGLVSEELRHQSGQITQTYTRWRLAGPPSALIQTTLHFSPWPQHLDTLFTPPLTKPKAFPLLLPLVSPLPWLCADQMHAIGCRHRGKQGSRKSRRSRDAFE